MKDLNLSFLHNISEDDKLLIERLSDFISVAEEKYYAKYTKFLDDRQVTLLSKVLASMSFTQYSFYGGYEEASRKILGIFPPNFDVDSVNTEDFPIKAIKITYRIIDEISHRDILGALMSLGIKRELIGDIIVCKGESVVLASEQIFDYIIQNVTKIGRIGVKLYENDEKISVSEPELIDIMGTVASLRADCVISLALNKSREKVSDIIKQSGFIVNHETVLSRNFIFKENDVFSLRGYGKYILKSVDGLSRKNKIHITINKYV